MAAVAFADADIAVGGDQILGAVTVDIIDGEFVGVIGPSGSGKSTLLRAIAGFADIVRGRLTFDGVDMARVDVAKRDVGMVFQQPVLFRNRSVERNVSFPLELRHRPPDEIKDRVGAEVRAMHFEHLLDRRPDSLSRGEAQLVQVARAMVRTPRVLLLDEPLASLDDALRRQIRAELRLLQDGFGVTTVMATNDPDDAMSLSHRLVVLADGGVVQVDTPEAVRRSPATVDAALATGECWTLPVRVVADSDGYWLERAAASGRFRHRAWAPVLADWVGAEVLLVVRPDDIEVTAAGPVPARVERYVPGQPSTIICDVAGRIVGVHDHGAAARAVAPGDAVQLRVDRAVVFDAATGRAISAV